jgi:cell division protein FtsQ
VAVTVASDRRFRRAHVKPGRRRRSWRAIGMPMAKSLALIALLAFGGYRLATVVTHAHVLLIDRIVVHGNERMSSAEVAVLLSGLRGTSLLFTDLAAWRDKLIASPWIRDASLRRSLPSTVEVVVAERQPVGVGRIQGEMYLVDEGGIIIDRFGPQYADLDLPIIDGLSIPSRDDGSMTDEPRAELAARVITALKARPEVAKRLSQIDVSDLHNAAVILNGDAAVIHLGEDQFLQRLQSYLELAEALRERVAEIDSVDLRFDDRIYVRPVKTSARRKEAPERKAR